MDETHAFNLLQPACTELQSLKKYWGAFECVLLSTTWIEILFLLQRSNLLTQGSLSNMMLDVEMKNVDNLIANISQIQEKWDKSISRSKLVAANSKISM